MNNSNDTLKNILKKYDLKAKKKFGQNFLHDKNIINQIVKKVFFVILLGHHLLILLHINLI